MKSLKKIRLINWHRFTNETIELADACLLSGENGAGKSTILDAIQLVITASKNHFNKAAQEKGRRTLNTYIRCKTGNENKPYERTGELSAHVALEFLDEQKNIPFIVGCAMDSASEQKEPNTAWYLIERRNLDDEMFFKGQQVRSISSFRSANSRQIKVWATTQKQARAMVLQRFGRLENKFFDLIPKALAFKPISDIKDFVYSYVLDEKDVNIDALRQNVRSYQDLSHTLEEVKKQIAELEEITSKHDRVENCIRIDRNHEYFLARADQEILKKSAGDMENKIRSEEIRRDDLERQLDELTKTISAREEMITDLSAELRSDSAYQAYMELDRRRLALEEVLAEDERAVRSLMQEVRIAIRDTKKLQEQKKEIIGDLGPCVAEYLDALHQLRQLESLVELRDLLEQVVSYKNRLRDRLIQREAEQGIQLSAMEGQQQELLGQIRELEKKKLIYPEGVSRLQGAVEAQLRKSGRTVDVRILCEQLEITDPKWQNAVEGYLNTQRFYLLVRPEDFDLSVSTYDRLRREKKAYGVGLVNTAKLDAYDEAPEGSLAEKVTSKNLYARRYINMLLGKVHCCDRVEDLKKYPVSITKGCMRYQNRVVSAIRPEVFRTPYIGAKAYEVQLSQKQEELAELKEKMQTLKAQKQAVEKAAGSLDTRADVAVKYQLSALEKDRADKAALAEVKKDLKSIGAEKTLIEKQIRLQQLQQDKKKLDAESRKLSESVGSVKNEIDGDRAKVVDLKSQAAEKSREVENLVDRLGDDWKPTEERFQKELGRRESMGAFRSNFESARKANQTSREKYTREMEELMHSYKVAHDFGAAATWEGYPDFFSEYARLKDSRLVDYEEQVQKARESAEEEFREQFLSRLQENIKQAQTEFRELNRALKDIRFANERYEFQYAPRASAKKYYSMIMDDFNVMQGESIFSGLFNETHKEVIEELFEKLSLDDENSQKVLEEYTDYRTYMDYDIKITGGDGSYMYYSKVLREKSGGETQTPFYITIAASFMQLYRSSIGGDSIGLVMMDEAFNNMDDERIQGVLSFMRSADLQLIISAPPEKIQYIGPAMDKVLLVLTEGQQSYVEDFTHET